MKNQPTIPTKKITSTTIIGILSAIGAVIFIVLYIIRPGFSIFPLGYGPKAILQRNINNIQPFFKDMEIIEHEQEGGFQYSYNLVVATIPKDRIQEFMDTVSLKDCDRGRLCVEPSWFVWGTVRGLTNPVSEPEKSDLEASLDAPGQLCTSAIGGYPHSSSGGTHICINTKTETFTFMRASF